MTLTKYVADWLMDEHVMRCPVCYASWGVQGWDANGYPHQTNFLCGRGCKVVLNEDGTHGHPALTPSQFWDRRAEWYYQDHRRRYTEETGTTPWVAMYNDSAATDDQHGQEK